VEEGRRGQHGDVGVVALVLHEVGEDLRIHEVRIHVVVGGFAAELGREFFAQRGQRVGGGFFGGFGGGGLEVGLVTLLRGLVFFAAEHGERDVVGEAAVGPAESAGEHVDDALGEGRFAGRQVDDVGGLDAA